MSKIFKYALKMPITILKFEGVKPTFLRAGTQDSDFGDGMFCWVRLDAAPNTVTTMTLRLVMTGEEFSPNWTWLSMFETDDDLMYHVLLASLVTDSLLN